MRRFLKLDFIHVGTCTGITRFKAVQPNSCLDAGAAWYRNGINDDEQY